MAAALAIQKPPQGNFSPRRHRARRNRCASRYRLKRNSPYRLRRTSGAPVFANGAVTGAFSYAFGELARRGAGGLNADAYATTNGTWDFETIETEYFGPYDELPSQLQVSVQLHEIQHVQDLTPFAHWGPLASIRASFAFGNGSPAVGFATLEVRGYEAGLNYLHNNVPLSGSAYLPQYESFRAAAERRLVNFQRGALPQ